MNPTAQRLDTLIDRRRLDRGLRWKDVADEVGVTQQTLLEARKGRQLSDLTASGIERFMEWQPGSVHRVLDGGDPIDKEAGADPLTAPVETWDARLVGPEGVVDEGEVLMWRDTPTGRLYRLADAEDTRVHTEYEFPPGETPEQVIDDLRGLLYPHRANVHQMERRRARR